MTWIGFALTVFTVDGKPKVLDDDTVSPGLVGSLVVLLLAVAVFFLLRSFVKQLRKVKVAPTDPAAPDPAPRPEP